MPIETNFYSTLQGPDILGNVQQGMKMSDLIKERKQKDKLIADQAKMSDIAKSAVITNPDGSTSYDGSKLPGAYANAGFYDQAAQSQKGLDDRAFEQKKLDSSMADRADAREERRSLMGMQLQDRRDARNQAAQQRADALAEKAQNLAPTQAKQLGLYESGAEAEAQYKKAIADGAADGYDPTSYMDALDNSSWTPNFLKNDHAIAADSAKDRWVESYLRDASGAAIAPSERGAYAKDFFPQKGDSAEVAAAKERARQFKMETSRVAAGGAGGAKQFAVAPSAASTQTSAPKDGSTYRHDGMDYMLINGTWKPVTGVAKAGK